jgi:hypothetical protein
LFARTDKGSMSLALLIAIAVIAVAIPTCQMVGCDMSMPGGMMRISTHLGGSFGQACDGRWVSSSTQYAVPPSGFSALLLSLFAAIAAAAVLFSPRVALRPVRFVDANGPPPPLEPRGERFTV